MKQNFIFQWSEGQSALNAEMWSLTLIPVAKIIGNNDFQAIFLVENRATTAFVDKSFVKLADQYSKIFLEEGFRQKFLAQTSKARKEFESFHEKFSKLDLRKLSNNELATLLEEYYAHYLSIGVPFNFSQQEFTEKAKLFLQSQLEKNYEKREVPEIISALLSFDKLDWVKREEKELAELALQGAQDASLEKHSLKHAGLFYNSYDKPTNLNFLRGRAEKLLALERKGILEMLAKMEREAQKNQRKHASVFEKVKDEKVREVAILLRELGFDRFELKNYWAGAEYKFLPLFFEIARRTALPLKELMSVYRLQDIKEALLQGKELTGEEVARRKKAYLFHYKQGKIIFRSGESAQKLAGKLVPNHFTQHASGEVSGNPANPGKARGIARVVKVVGVEELVKDIEAFKKGEILITTMTQPNMVQLAAKASAILTNEGGVTSHAAVLAREFGIPCIVGTHDATRAFKTGDLIEVDAFAGKARLIRAAEKQK